MSDVAHIFRAMFNGSLLDEGMVTEFLTTSSSATTPSASASAKPT
ncbi:MAG: hypothetical protein Ct9H300mP31_19970 [Acidimicrobiaceae bacterium]|nr:MAG: hypothetical protein Ct9H300mP31_19970 [Acidimicrobiaceae bacterium]